MADRTARSHPAEAYSEAEQGHAAVESELARSVRAVEAGRMGTFLVAAVVGLLWNDLPVPPRLALAVSASAALGFVVLVVRHRRLSRRLRRVRVARSLARLGLARLRRDWDAVSSILGELGYSDRLLEEPAGQDETHPYLLDLDLTGPESVRALLGPTPTPTGSETLEGWLRAPAPIGEVRRRQAAVRSMVPDQAARAALTTEALLLDPVGRAAWRRFHDWLQSPPVFRSSSETGTADATSTIPSWAGWVSFALPAVTLTMLAVWTVSVGIPALTWLAPLAVQLYLARRWGGILGDYFDAASGKSPGLRRHHALFAAWEHYEPSDPRVAELQGRLRGEGNRSASEEIRTLERWLDAVDSRASMFHVVFATGFFWDVHVARGLERWRARAGVRVPGWFEAVGELEALSALATLAYDEPEWCFPELREGPPGMEAVGLGHPLLSDEVRRTSDVQVDPPGRFLLVTGSNMSGKSTILRSIGLAAVLGQTGSVVCARRLEMSPLQTFTSMRIRDSLTDGVSHFMAELLRLKALVDAVPEGTHDPALLYLIDEVLQGTNSEERRVAARRIVRHLLASHAVGAVTTHDLALHDDPTLDPASRKVHFRETVGGEGAPLLTFDYVLRPGLATSRNALKLLRLVGLDSPPEMESKTESLHPEDARPER